MYGIYVYREVIRLWKQWGGREEWRCDYGMPAGNVMKNVGGIGDFNSRVEKKKRKSKYKNSHCVEEIAGMICPEELPVYKFHWHKINISSMYL